MERKQQARYRTIFGVDYWNCCYKYTKKINFNNKIKWLQFQLVRGCLPVNNKISRYMNEVSSLCTFCKAEPETDRHLFFHCKITNPFLRSCFNFIGQIGHTMDFDNTRPWEFMLIQRIRLRCFKCFFFMLHMKHFIWLTRCAGSVPTLIAFKSYLKKELELLVQCIHIYTELEFVANCLRIWNDL